MAEQEKPKIDLTKIYYCHNCINANKIPGDCHIRCANPPKKQMKVDNASDAVRFAVQYALAQTVKELPDSPIVVIRCIWGGSGFYPLCFDSNTVVACSNFQVKGGLP